LIRIKTNTCGLTWAHVLDHNVRLICELLQNAAAKMMSTVNSYSPLPSIGVVKVSSHLVACFPNSSREVRRCGGFNLDDVGTEISQQHG
jgi:hypothetical protein